MFRDAKIAQRRPFAVSEGRELAASETERLFARLFNTEDGRKVLSVLANETAGTVVPVSAGPETLQRMEGKRELVADIVQRVEKGMKR